MKEFLEKEGKQAQNQEVFFLNISETKKKYAKCSDQNVSFEEFVEKAKKRWSEINCEYL